MPLSEEELRLLEQMERALVQEDPKFASALRGTNIRRSSQRKLILAGVGFVVGIALLMTGVVTQMPVVSVVGFVVMLGAGSFGLTAARARPAVLNESHQVGNFTVITGGRASRPKRAPKHGTFMQRMELRWEKRRRDF